MPSMFVFSPCLSLLNQKPKWSPTSVAWILMRNVRPCIKLDPILVAQLVRSIWTKRRLHIRSVKTNKTNSTRRNRHLVDLNRSWIQREDHNFEHISITERPQNDFDEWQMPISSSSEIIVRSDSSRRFKRALIDPEADKQWTRSPWLSSFHISQRRNRRCRTILTNDKGHHNSKPKLSMKEAYWDGSNEPSFTQIVQKLTKISSF